MYHKIKELSRKPLAYVLLIYLVLNLCAYLVNLFNTYYWKLDFLGNTYYMVLLYLLQTILIFAFLAFIKSKNKWKFDDFGFRKTDFFSAVGYIVAAYLGYFVISLSVLSILREFGLYEIPGFLSQDSYLAVFGTDLFGIISLALAALLIAPFSEEILFRGYLLENLVKEHKPLWALTISALLFALFHFQLGSFFFLFILGILIGWVYLKTRSIWPCIVLHALNNTAAFLVEIFLK